MRDVRRRVTAGVLCHICDVYIPKGKLVVEIEIGEQYEWGTEICFSCAKKIGQIAEQKQKEASEPKKSFEKEETDTFIMFGDESGGYEER